MQLVASKAEEHPELNLDLCGSMRVLLFDTSNYYFHESRASFTIFGVTGI